MRRDRIIKAVNTLKDALQAAQIRELLRAARNGQQAEGVNRTQKILLAYNVFMRHYQEFDEEEKEMMTFFGLTPLLDLAFWSALVDGEQAVSRKIMADVDVGAYNVIFVMPKLRDLLTRETDRDQLIVADPSGTDQEIKRLRMLVAEKERSLTDPHVIINVMRSLDEFYEGMAALRGGNHPSLSVGAIDSGSTKSFDFFGSNAIIDEISELLIAVWDRIKYSAEENFRYQIEVAMMAAGFINRVKDAQAAGRVNDEQGQRITRSVAKAIETLFRAGAYTDDMDLICCQRPNSWNTAGRKRVSSSSRSRCATDLTPIRSSRCSASRAAKSRSRSKRLRARRLAKRIPAKWPNPSNAWRKPLAQRSDERRESRLSR
jgi:hypothetical protein